MLVASCACGTPCVVRRVGERDADAGGGRAADDAVERDPERDPAHQRAGEQCEADEHRDRHRQPGRVGSRRVGRRLLHGHEAEEDVGEDQLLPDAPEKAATVARDRHEGERHDGDHRRQAEDFAEGDHHLGQRDKRLRDEQNNQKRRRKDEQPARKRAEESSTGRWRRRHGIRQIAKRIITD